MTFATDYFDRDIAAHTMQVIRDDGLNRHLRFQRPGTMCMHFDLLTWPGYLCYTGDMGTYVFRRLPDMFEFFRSPKDRPKYNIDLRYWAEKLEAGDRFDGPRVWSPEKFRDDLRDYFEMHVADDEDLSHEQKSELWEEIKAKLYPAIELGEHHAWVALHEFEHDGFWFEDWSSDGKAWSHRFLWCCHALEWAIGVYDAESNDHV